MFNLSDDIIEVFRPIVDNYVLRELTDAIFFKQTHREELIQLTTKKIVIDSKKQTVINAINQYLDSIFNYLDGKTRKIIFPLPIVYDL